MQKVSVTLTSKLSSLADESVVEPSLQKDGFDHIHVDHDLTGLAFGFRCLPVEPVRELRSSHLAVQKARGRKRPLPDALKSLKQYAFREFVQPGECKPHRPSRR